MKIIKFLAFLFLPSIFLHQAYAYNGENDEPTLQVEFVIFDVTCEGNCKIGFMAWGRALWSAAG